MRYHDFDLRIEPGLNGKIALHSHCDVHGDFDDVTSIDRQALETDEALLTAEQIERAAVVSFGTRLNSCIFAAQQGNIDHHFTRCLGYQDGRVRGTGGVRVRLFVEAPDLAVIPWEYIFSKRLQWGFVGISAVTPIVRFLRLPQAIGSLEVKLPVRMLLAIPDSPGLQTKMEREQILATLEPLRDTVQVTPLFGEVTRQQLTDTLATERFDLLHFVGHGDFDEDRAVLVFNRAGGGDELVDHERMASILRNHESMKLVVLNSCRGAQLSASKPFVGMAAELVKLGVPAVIAMQYEIRDDQALCFARVLYRHLFVGADKGRIEIAISHARNALADEFRDSNAVGLPVLFMHAQEGVLFDLVTGNRLRDMPISPRAVEVSKATERTHEHNVKLLEPQAAAGDAAASKLLAAERDALDRVRRRIRFRHATIGSVVAIGLILILGVLFFGVQRLSPVISPDSYYVLFTDLFGHHHDGAAVTVIAIDSATTRVLGPPDGAWRGRHSIVVNRLTNAGARTIAFNISFPEQAEERLLPANDSLARAFREARASGTAILVAADSVTDGVPNVATALAPSVLWGINCVEEHKRLTAQALRVTIASAAAGRTRRLHSLPLAAVAAFAGASFNDGGPVRSSLPRGSSGVAASAVLMDSLIYGVADSACSVNKGDTVYRMIVDHTKRSELRDPEHRLSYLDALQGASLGDLRGKLVLVGAEVGEPFTIQRGFAAETRFGLDLEADAINTLLRGVIIRPLPQRQQFAAILVMAVLGALCARAFVRFGKTGVVVALPASVVLYFVLGALLYATQHELLNTMFDLLALVLTFGAVWYAHRTLFP